MTRHKKPYDPEIQAPRQPRSRDCTVDLDDDDVDEDVRESESAYVDAYRPDDEATSTDRHRYSELFAVGVGLWD